MPGVTILVALTHKVLKSLLRALAIYIWLVTIVRHENHSRTIRIDQAAGLRAPARVRRAVCA